MCRAVKSDPKNRAEGQYCIHNKCGRRALMRRYALTSYWHNALTTRSCCLVLDLANQSHSHKFCFLMKLITFNYGKLWKSGQRHSSPDQCDHHAFVALLLPALTLVFGCEMTRRQETMPGPWFSRFSDHLLSCRAPICNQRGYLLPRPTIQLYGRSG